MDRLSKIRQPYYLHLGGEIQFTYNSGNEHNFVEICVQWMNHWMNEMVGGKLNVWSKLFALLENSSQNYAEGGGTLQH